MESSKFQQFLVPIVLLLAAIGVLGYLGNGVWNNIQGLTAAKADYEAAESSLQEAQERLEQAKKNAADQAQRQQQLQQEKENQKEEKPFYKPVMSGMDTEAAISGEFEEILQLIRLNRIKVRTIKYDPDPQDDDFVKGAPAEYNVSRLNIEMIANYLDLDNFLKELYKHEHFLDIQSVEIVPYRKNKKILLINFKLKLYAKK